MSPARILARSLGFATFGALTALLTACSGTGQPAVDYPAFAVATVPGTIAAGDFTLSLDEALVAFGPAYFCASATGSSTLCETALAEITETSTIDALSPEPQPLGTVYGLTGEIRSTSYDYGFHWFLTENEPKPSASAPFGHSARFRGRAEREGVSVSFVANIDVRPQFRGQRAVTTAPASANITEESAPSTRLEIHLDVAPWLAAIDWENAAASTEQPFVIESGSPEHNAVVTAMQSTHQPSFVWSASP
ncbi:MAG TPA: hypothetical protein VK459_21320 [Polyangiaceae bacterium]|jgi:hypothetical protein|nr:hypothetical protein [Polyangiaceae bacterium]